MDHYNQRTPYHLLIDGVLCTLSTIDYVNQTAVYKRPNNGISIKLDASGINHHLSVARYFVNDTQVRYSKHSGYECSSNGDQRFSAFNAIMSDGRSIEHWYQAGALDGRGKQFAPGTRNWKLGKGKCWPGKTPEQLYSEYYSFWEEWCNLHLAWMVELHYMSSLNDYLLRDSFATSPINQARALAEFINSYSWDDTSELDVF